MGKVKERVKSSESYCAQFQCAVELIGRRWTGAIVRALLGGVYRFSDLKNAIPDLSEKMLSERLKELETMGIVKREVFPETPVRIEYLLTPSGQALGNVMDVIGEWAHGWLEHGKG
jgi:DNA-binding HxlR family transcriptional regulator